MATEQRKAVSGESFPLRLIPSFRKNAEAFSEKEGVSLNQFINVAVAERLAHLEHDEWLHNRKVPSSAKTLEAMNVLNELGTTFRTKVTSCLRVIYLRVVLLRHARSKEHNRCPLPSLSLFSSSISSASSKI